MTRRAVALRQPSSSTGTLRALLLGGLCLVARSSDEDRVSCASGELGEDGSCAASSSAASFQRLQWRSQVYQLDPKGVYGGSWIERELDTSGFDGPVTDTHDWDLLWTHRHQSKGLAALHERGELPERPGRLVNHCQYFTAAGQKCLLARHIEKIELAKGAEPKRYLKTYRMIDSNQSLAWRKELERDPDRFWVVKTCTGGASKEVQLVTGRNIDVIEGTVGTHAVAQEYLQRPFLSKGVHKFHLRLYMVVTSWSPVSAFLLDDGLIFRSRHVHTIGKPTQSRDVFSSVSQDVEPLPLSAIWDELGEARAQKAQTDIQLLLAELLSTSLRATFGDPAKLSDRGYECFDMYGVDIMFDETLQPWLLELNIGPDMWIDRRGDEHAPLLSAAKKPLIKELFTWAAARSQELKGNNLGGMRPEDALTSFKRIV